MTGPFLRGVDPVIEAVIARLEVALPVELAALDLVYGRPAPAPDGVIDTDPDLWRYPTPRSTPEAERIGLYSPSDRGLLEPDDYPAILCVPQTFGPGRVIDMVAGAPVLEVPYALRLFGFVRHYGYEHVVACRNRFGDAILQALLRTVVLDEHRSIDPGSWRGSYSEAAVEDGYSFAGLFIDVTVLQREQISVAQLAPADPENESLQVLVDVHPEADPEPVG